MPFDATPSFYQLFPNLPTYNHIFPIFLLTLGEIGTQYVVEVDVAKLKTLRKQRVLTIEQLAARAGVSKNTISKAENGGSVYPSTIHKLAKALQVEPSKLVKLN